MVARAACELFGICSWTGVCMVFAKSSRQKMVATFENSLSPRRWQEECEEKQTQIKQLRSRPSFTETSVHIIRRSTHSHFALFLFLPRSKRIARYLRISFAQISDHSTVIFHGCRPMVFSCISDSPQFIGNIRIEYRKKKCHRRNSNHRTFYVIFMKTTHTQ